MGTWLLFSFLHWGGDWVVYMCLHLLFRPIPEKKSMVTCLWLLYIKVIQRELCMWACVESNWMWQFYVLVGVDQNSQLGGVFLLHIGYSTNRTTHVKVTPLNCDTFFTSKLFRAYSWLLCRTMWYSKTKTILLESKRMSTQEPDMLIPPTPHWFSIQKG